MGPLDIGGGSGDMEFHLHLNGPGIRNILPPRVIERLLNQLPEGDPDRFHLERLLHDQDFDSVTQGGEGGRGVRDIVTDGATRRYYLL